jgi:hypothetical protein
MSSGQRHVNKASSNFESNGNFAILFQIEMLSATKYVQQKILEEGKFYKKLNVRA